MNEGETFGDRLRKRMKEKGVSMPELGKGLKPRKNGVLEGDLGRAAVYGWLNGNGFPNVIQFAAICRKLDISADVLLFGGISNVRPEVERAAEAVKALTGEERAALFAVINGPALSDAEVENHLPPAPSPVPVGPGGYQKITPIPAPPKPGAKKKES